MIRLEAISKHFRLYRSPTDRLKEIFLRRHCHVDFLALKDVSLEVNKGEVLGIIGENGAGKSTLLKILMGILLPEQGLVSVDGRVTGLLELGTGFNSEMTGLENIFMNGLLIGMSRQEIDERLQDIISFAELGEFIHEPIKTYSSGMVMRLAFAVAIHANPECFVVDEALAVGDAYFQQKCMRRVKDFKASGGAIVFVSHDLNAVKVLCDRVALLNHGEVIEAGQPEKVINTYNLLLAKKSQGDEIRFGIANNRGSYGNFKVEIEKLEFFNEQGIDARVFSSGERCRIRVCLKANNDVDQVVTGILLRDRFGQDVFGTNTHHLGKSVAMVVGQTAECEFEMVLNIGPGKYTLTAAAHKDSTHVEESYHWHDNALRFEVTPSRDYAFVGIAKLDCSAIVRL